jgi:hypothetical protein
MQSAPAIALALAARASDDQSRRRIALVAAAAGALYLSLSMRAGVQTIFALGFPFVSLRYVSPAIPLLLVLAIVAVEEAGWRHWHLLAAAVLATAIAVWLARTPNDLAHARRVFLLRIVPFGGLVAVLLTIRFSSRSPETREDRLGRSVAIAAAIVFAFGVGVTTGVDGRAVFDVRAGNDARVDALARVAPRRFALVGWPPEIDTPLALRASRDIVYADLYESENWANFRTLIDRWSAEQRPIFAMWPNDAVVSPWQEVVFMPVDRSQHIYRVVLVRR